MAEFRPSSLEDLCDLMCGNMIPRAKKSKKESKRRHKMRAKVNLRVEILDGEDKGYVLEETNRLVDLKRTPREDYIVPYRLVLEFVTPDLLRRGQESKEADNEDSD